MSAEPKQHTEARPSSVPKLTRHLSEHETHERRQALRALLRDPLMTAHGPHADTFVLVRRHATWLREWFMHQTGWSLHVGSELARLFKTTADTSDATHPAMARPGEPFSRRRYVLLCLALAAMERMDRQTTLDQIARCVVQLVAEDDALGQAGIEFTLEGRSQRRDMVVIIRFLIGLGVLTRVQGDEEAFVSERGDVLYQINRPLLSRLLHAGEPPSLVRAEGLEDRLGALAGAYRPIDNEQGRRAALRHKLVRLLLDGPVVYYDELDDNELDYLQRTRGVILPQLTEATGLVAEVRAEGIALTDPRGDLTDVKLPEEGTEGHLTLLLAEYLAEEAGGDSDSAGRALGRPRNVRGLSDSLVHVGVPQDVEGGPQSSTQSARSPFVPISELEAHTRELARLERYGKHWRKAAREPGAEKQLVRACLERLAALRLVKIEGDAVRPRPAITRYALLEPRAPEETKP